MSTVYEATPPSFSAYNTPSHLDEDAYPSNTQEPNFSRSTENISGSVSGVRNAPQKSMIRKILNIAAKIAVVTAAVLFVKKACFAAVSATISSPFSLALTTPGLIFWYVVVREEGFHLINKINCKINSLI